MCGIAGIVSRNSSLISKERIASGTSCLQHRGPEHENIWISPGQQAGLGHRRLSIIDLSAEASQPMHYPGGYTIIHNGEIYNYSELKEVLSGLGHAFNTRSDTEVILAAYAQWGKECVQHFDGMFAFAIWDETEKKLFVARDRFGEKPLYFFIDDEQFAFGSEIKTLWSFGLAREVNTSMLYNFITTGYTANPSDPEETFYQNVGKLPAASLAIYDLTSHELLVEKYWQIYPESTKISDEDALEEFQRLFSDSIRKRLRSDVAIGTSLSGGLDSSAIVAMCEEQASGQYTHNCFTSVFPGFEKDELKYAKAVADQFGLKHHIVEIHDGDVVPLMQEVMKHQQEPFSSGSVLAQYKVYAEAKKQGVTVLLDGQGADEVLAGYRKYFKWYWQELYSQGQLSRSGEKNAAAALGVQETFGIKNKVYAWLPEFASGILQTRKSKGAFNHPGLDRDFAFRHKRELYYSTPTQSTLNGALFFDSFVYGLEELLRLADRNSMAHATEVRLPFLSHELVSFLFSLPANFKIRDGWTKWLLRKSVETKLAGSIAWRKDKTGFEPPQEQWMKHPDVRDSIMEGKKSW